MPASIFASSSRSRGSSSDGGPACMPARGAVGLSAVVDSAAPGESPTTAAAVAPPAAARSRPRREIAWGVLIPGPREVSLAPTRAASGCPEYTPRRGRPLALRHRLAAHDRAAAYLRLA